MVRSGRHRFQVIVSQKKSSKMANNTQNMNNSFEQAADNLLDAFLDMDYNKDTIIDSEELKPLRF